MSGNDQNCIFLLKGNGVDGSTDIIDSSPAGRILSRVGNVEIDDAQSHFGGASLKFNGGYLTLADNPVFALGAGDFTFEGFFTFDAVASSQYLFMQSDGSNVQYLLWYKAPAGNPNLLSFQTYAGGVNPVLFSREWNPVAGQEYHIQLKRKANVFTFKIDGVQLGSSYSTAGGVPNVNAPFVIGARSDGTQKFVGWMDEVRFSKVAREDAVPPTAEYTMPPPPTPPAVGESENNWYKDRAAMLDPDAYIYLAGPSFNAIEAEPVYLLNSWQTTWENNPNNFYYHRKTDIDNALMLPAGTKIQHCGSPPGYGFEYGYAYYAKPSLVNSDPRYEDGRDLYYRRLEALKHLTLHSLDVKIAQGQTVAQAVAANQMVKAFPADFENGLIVQFSMMDGCWMVIEDPAPPSGIQTILNLSDELDDVRSQRWSGEILAPFKRSKFPQLRIGFGSVFAIKTGTPNNPITPVGPDVTTYPNYGQIKYYKLDELAALGIDW